MSVEPRAPLTPPDCDLRDFNRMMIDIPRLRSSAFDATPDDAAWRAGINLWLSGFHAVPAASLDDDEAALCKAAGLGRDLKTWRKVRAGAMRGWVLCSDGRWYHLTVAEFALEAWIEKLVQRLSSGAGNAKRWGGLFDPTQIRADLIMAAALLAGLNAASKALQKASRWIEKPSQPDAENVPTGSKIGPDRMQKRSQPDQKTVRSGSQEKRQRREEPSSLRSDGDAAPPSGGEVSPAFIAIDTNVAGKTFVVTEGQVAEFKELYPSVDVEQELRSMRGWALANPGKRKTAGGMLRFITSWLAKEQNKGPRKNGTGSGIGNHHNGHNGAHALQPSGAAFSIAARQRVGSGLFDRDEPEDGSDGAGPVSRVDREAAIDLEPDRHT